MCDYSVYIYEYYDVHALEWENEWVEDSERLTSTRESIVTLLPIMVHTLPCFFTVFLGLDVSEHVLDPHLPQCLVKCQEEFHVHLVLYITRVISNDIPLKWCEIARHESFSCTVNIVFISGLMSW